MAFAPGTVTAFGKNAMGSIVHMRWHRAGSRGGANGSGRVSFRDRNVVRSAPAWTSWRPHEGRHTSHIVASSPAVEEAAAKAAARGKDLTKEDLVDFLRSGCKPKSEWRIGTEHEKLGFQLDTLKRMTFDQISKLLDGMASRFGYERVMEGENIIGLSKDGASVSLEPGGQFELSGAPLKDVHACQRELDTHLEQVNIIGKELGLRFAGIGYEPKWPLSERPNVPKARYQVIKDYFPKIVITEVGFETMYQTCTAQVNLDFDSEQDMINKLRVGLSLQPLATALFANSPFWEGKPAGYKTYRSFLWSQFDDDRTGELPFVFDDDFGFEKYTEYALNVPMLMVHRNDNWRDVSGASFKNFMAGKLEAYPGEKPSLNDWMNHLGTMYPEVRLKKYLEMRGADCCPKDFLNALPAFWVGLLYDEQSLKNCLDIIRDWSNDDRGFLRKEVPNQGILTPFREGTLQDVAKDVLKLAKDGLARRGLQEGKFLAPLEEVATTGVTLAERMLKLYEEEWDGRVDPIFNELRL
ncbi:glutamate--cysteine ligase A, chloroplastic isoform X2 [Physcomitrium patens]|uniref:glutamate--cysteine ligase n=2 Tax=Physcomitrium patens TaxID=3218 RepID=A0A2K1IN74_PHYPA|nr:glutamate--cysteine ligase A, chloroplastic-like isoform X2 [Physcomitrium patens]PNR30732.1 hypothetical protein PHYPA_027048 [Physcomitrium patens]|eukprot:XP_024360231.1 glutamate--cysteine ligase A, chloroplastic-like isoform X2 [Physcomitrella patens]